MFNRWCALGCLTLLLAPAGLAHARQAGDAYTAPPAHLAVVDGSATLERNTRAEPALANVPLMAGDRLRTTDGRIEILFADGSTLDVDRDTTLDLLAPSLLRLLNGRIRLTVAGGPESFDPATTAIYRVDAPGGIVQTAGPGVYDVTASDARAVEVSVAVVRGAATLSTERASLTLRAGERTAVRNNGVPQAAAAFNVALSDAFSRWADARRESRVGSRTADYLPLNLDAYAGALDRGGQWAYLAPYGYVWYPQVPQDWRPYSDGRWQDVGPYGWTWVGSEAWAWPVFHYGRWGRSNAAWYWVPGRQWSPAWVSWAVAPGLVSWCALNVNGAPAVDLYHPGRHGSASRGWVAVRHGDFNDRDVARRALRDDALHARPRTFIEQRTPPVPARGRAVTRSRAGAATPRSRMAVPRSLYSRSSRVVMPAGGTAVAPLQGSRTSAMVRPGTSDTAVSKFPSRTLGTSGPGVRTILPRPSWSRPATGRIIGSPWSAYRTMSSARESAAERHGTGWRAPRFVAPSMPSMPSMPSTTVLPRIVIPRTLSVPDTGAGMRTVAPAVAAPTGVALPGGMKPIMPVTTGIAAPATIPHPTIAPPAAGPHGTTRRPAGRSHVHHRGPRQP